MSSSSSDGASLAFALLNGAASANPDVVASFRVGDNSISPDGLPEFALGGDGAEYGHGDAAPAGHITWDAGYSANDASGEFFSVAPVRLRMDAKQIRWSVGTADFISRPVAPFRQITKVQVTAAAATTAGDLLDGVVRWDLLEICFRGADGRAQRHASPCLPRASSRPAFRRAAAAEGDRRSILQQYAEIVGPRGAVEFELKGQVTLSARRTDGAPARPLSADDLQGQVLIFTE